MAKQLGVTEPVEYQSGEVIDLKRIAGFFWRARWVLVLALIVGLLGGYRAATNYQPVYEASMTIMPISGQFSSGSSAGPAAASGVAAIGIALGPKPVSNFERLRVLVGSQDFAQYLNEKYDLMTLFFGDAKDPKSRLWRKPEGSRYESDENLRRKLGLGVWAEPNLGSLASAVRDSLKFKEINQGMFYKVSLAHPDRERALWLLQTIFREADGKLRDADRGESTEKRRYLDQQLRAASVVELRTALAQLISMEERQAMLLAGDLAYSARIVDSPEVTSQPLPQQILAIMLPWIIGSLLFAVVAALLATLIVSEIEA
ncbi:MAG: hypothetical protein FJX47_06395 [Alphaproteobacteria bacterium]|nr:hypothetical protein [Alphaproteobacteria bacterium]